MENQIAESGIVANAVRLVGKYVAGRDIKISEAKISLNKPEFSEVNLESYKKGNYLSPKFSGVTLQLLKEKRVIIIGGSYGFDKGSFVRHLASLVIDEKNDFAAKEWIYSSDFYSVFSLMQEEKKSCIFILNQILPQNVNYDIGKLIKIANEKSHYIIISTDSSIESWKISELIHKETWFEIPTFDLYETNLLVEFFTASFLSNKEDLNFSDKKDSYTFESFLDDKELLNNISIKLQSPHRIDLLIKLLSREKEIITKEVIETKLSLITQGTNHDILNHWFNTLSDNQKIIALGVVLFDGLYDDQFFSAIKYVVDDYWYLRNQTLKALDYFDLDCILNFYKLETIDLHKKVLKSRFPNQRFELLKTIWFSHRRHIILALPSLVRILKDSINYSYSNWELFGNLNRKEKLYSVISDTLSDIGLISLPAVETILIELASDNNIEIQSVAAKAIAKWREQGKSDFLFKMLENWQKETRVKSILEDILEKRDAKENAENIVDQSQASKKIEYKGHSRSYIRSTIALTLGYASQYDSPNQLSDKILSLILQLCKDNDDSIRERLQEITLPTVISQHFNQIEKHLLEFTKQSDFLHPIAVGFSNAYNNYPSELLNLLNKWITDSRSKNQLGKGQGYNEVDRVIVAVILTLGEINYSINDPVFNIATGYELIIKLQKIVKQKKFRDIFIFSIKRQLRNNFDKCKGHIIQLIENLSIDEQKEISDILLDKYYTDREELKNGEDVLIEKNRYIPIWIDKDRPITNTENFLFSWLESDNVVAQQLATTTLMRFAKDLDYKEKKIIDYVKETRDKIAEETVTTDFPEDVKTTQESTKLMKIAVSLNSPPKESKIKQILKNIVPVILKDPFFLKDHFEIIEKNFKRKGGNIKELGEYLTSAFNNYKLVRNIFNISIFLAIIIFIIVLLYNK